MRYSRLRWNHDSPGEPIEILSEHDEDGWERRKVELFRDGSIGFASKMESVGGSKLSLIRRPPDEEVIDEPEVMVFEMPRDEFELHWSKARQVNHVA